MPLRPACRPAPKPWCLESVRAHTHTHTHTHASGPVTCSTTRNWASMLGEKARARRRCVSACACVCVCVNSLECTDMLLSSSRSRATICASCTLRCADTGSIIRRLSSSHDICTHTHTQTWHTHITHTHTHVHALPEGHARYSMYVDKQRVRRCAFLCVCVCVCVCVSVAPPPLSPLPVPPPLSAVTQP